MSLWETGRETSNGVLATRASGLNGRGWSPLIATDQPLEAESPENLW
jgi:hypothetical protein